MPKLKDLFQVDGLRWETQSMSEETYAIHVEIPGKAHVCCWSYKGKKQYYVQRYHAGIYTGEAEAQWLDPMEAMCVMLEAQKEAASMSKPT